MSIVLVAQNARFAHTAFGLRYLKANLPTALRDITHILEFDLTARPGDIVEAILSHGPTIIGLGVHIWNARQAYHLATTLKQVAPAIPLILGGPEISHEIDKQPIAGYADHIITGEAELAFAELCIQLQRGQHPPDKIIHAEPPDPAQLTLPYDLYSDEDLTHRTIYVEASRGCPFRCAFCLSALDKTTRPFPLEPFLEAMQRLHERGLRRFKLVDRTFNLAPDRSRRILEFFLEHVSPELFVHIEVIPDRLPDALKETIARFPAGSLQLEMGFQSFYHETQARIGRQQNNPLAEENLRWLLTQTGVHLHTDLIIGLPGEDEARFGLGFDRLIKAGAQEIQVGILKRLRGAPIAQHSRPFGMIYSLEAPYELLANDLIPFERMQHLKRFARFWDLIGNSGRFPHFRGWLLEQDAPFTPFMTLSAWLFEVYGRRTHGISLRRLFGGMALGLQEALSLNPQQAQQLIGADFQRAFPSERADALSGLMARIQRCNSEKVVSGIQRQARHLRVSS
ncbi:MAG: DUF4080 domain-containing protein [Magnetococcales bacterium]|nr:DUF4080 domain-containing protein [Magnetococcales bacterium]